MKRVSKFILLFVAITSLVVVFCMPTTVAAESVSEIEQSKAYDELFALIQNAPARTSGAASGKIAEDYIFNRLNSFTGFDKVEFQEISGKSAITNEEISARNIIAFKDNPNTNDSVLITAYYDNVADIKLNQQNIGGDGTYASGTAIALMLETARQFSTESFDYDLYFVAFAAGEHGSLGAKSFISKFYNNDLTDVIFAIDLNMAVGGEFLYAYTDEVDTLHGDFIYKTAESVGASIKDVPQYKKQATAVVSSDSKIPYFHAGLSGHNLLFIEGGVPTVKFLSLNWSKIEKLGITEYDGKANVLQSSTDTLETITLRLGGEEQLKADLDNMSAIINNTLKADGFVSAMKESKAVGRSYADIFNTRWDIVFLVIKIVLIVGGIITVTLLTAQYRKKHPPANVVIIPTAAAPPVDPFDDDNDSPKNGGDVFDGFGF